MSTEEGKKDPQNWREATSALWERLEGIPTQEAFEALQGQVRQVEEHLAIEGDYFRGAIGGMEGRLQSAIKEGDEFAVLFETLQGDVNLLSENLVQIRAEFEDLARMFAKDGEDFDGMKAEIKSLQAFRERIDENMSDYIETATAAYGELSERVRQVEDLQHLQVKVGTDLVSKAKDHDRKFNSLFALTSDLNAWQNTILRRLEALEARWPLPDDVSRVQAREIAQREAPAFDWHKEYLAASKQLNKLRGEVDAKEARIASLEAALKTAQEEKERAAQDAGKWRRMIERCGRDWVGHTFMEWQELEKDAEKWRELDKVTVPVTNYHQKVDKESWYIKQKKVRKCEEEHGEQFQQDATLGALVRRMPELARQCGRRVALEYDEVGNIEAWQVKVPDRFLPCQKNVEDALRAALGDDNTKTPDRDGGVTRPEELGLYRAMEKAQEEAP